MRTIPSSYFSYPTPPICLRELALMGLLFLAILLIFFSTNVFGGQILAPSDIMFETPLFANQAPANYSGPSNPLLFDQAYQFIPWRALEWRAIQQGQIPAWNPYSSSGAPFIATMQSAFFYPINWVLARLLPFEQTLLWSAIIKLWVAGSGAYLLLRYYALQRTAAFIGALSFMLCGFMIVWLGHPHTNVACWLPWIIIVAEFTIQARGRRLLLGIGSIALIIGMMITGGHIESSADVLTAFGLYYLFRWLQTTWQQNRSIGSKLQKLILPPLIAVCLGCALSAIQLLPFMEWLPLSWEYQHRSARGFQFLSADFINNLLALPTFFFPNIYNNPTWAKPYNVFLPMLRGAYNEYILYFGILTAVLALTAVISKWRQGGVIRVWIILSFTALAMAMRLPVFDWLNYLPIRSLAHPERLRLVVLLGMSIVAAFGAQWLWTREEQRVRTIFRNFAILLSIIGLSILIGGNTILPALRSQISGYVRSLAEEEYERRSDAITHPIEEYYRYADRLVDNLLNAFHFSNIEMYASTGMILLGLLLLVSFNHRWRLDTLGFKLGLVLLVIVDLFIFGKRFNPSISHELFFSQPEIITKIGIHDQPFRFTTLQQSSLPDSHILWELADIRGLDFPTTWYNAYLNLAPERIPWLPYGSIFASVDSPLLHTLNVEYAYTDAKTDIDTEKWKAIYETPAGVLLQANHPVLRGRMLYKAINAPSDQVTINLLSQKPDLVYDTVILNGEATTLPDLVDSSPVRWQANSLNHDLNREEWHITTSRSGYFVVSDSYYPGWQVSIDGNSSSLYRANLAFRAVYVPAGDHRITFEYKPFWLPLGALMSVTALVIIGLLFILSIDKQQTIASA